MKEPTYTQQPVDSDSDTEPILPKEAVPDPKQDDGPVYCALSESERGRLLAIASFAAAIAPLSTTTYYPIVNLLADEFNVSITEIYYTISAYQVFQGLSPPIIAALSNRFGRRPIYLTCLIVNAAVALGLALQSDYDTLLILRSLQSASSSGTVALGSGVLDDLTTSDQRGKFLAYISLGYVLGPSIGPVLGGLMAQYSGWRAVFWFLTGFGAFFLVVSFVFLRETNRSFVGDGSIPPKKWNRSGIQMLRKHDLAPNTDSLRTEKRRFQPFDAIRILRNKENLIVCGYGALLYAGYSAIISVFASQLNGRYGFSTVQVGLCYLPIGAGSILSRFTIAKLIDWNFNREAQKQGLVFKKNRRHELLRYDIEKARLLISLPMILALCACVVLYGWLMQLHVHIAAVLVTMFFIANIFTGILVANSALLADLNPGNGAMLGATTMFTRSLLGAGGVAAATPIINRFGIGRWAAMLAAVWVAALPGLWFVFSRGHKWRLAAQAKKDQAVDTVALEKRLTNLEEQVRLLQARRDSDEGDRDSTELS